MLPVGRYQSVSIHAPREGRDVILSDIDRSLYKFQSTRPVKGATAFRRPGR